MCHVSLFLKCVRLLQWLGIAWGYHEESFVLISIRFIQGPLLALLVPAIHKEL
jgi:hypothetical protein